MILVQSVVELARHGVRDIVMACGVFDGVHRGHQVIISGLLQMARELKAIPVVLTFDPHPRAILYPHAPPQCLTVPSQKLETLARLGVEATVMLPFSMELAELTPAQFSEREFVAPGVNVRGICVGRNWRFGYRGRGDMDVLKAEGRLHGFVVKDVPELTWYGKPVSSTRIRQAIEQGRLSHARHMLGRPYRVRGAVVHGRGIGHSRLHCPTANLADPLILLPPDGIYAARSILCQAGGTPGSYPGVVYIGSAPTFGPSSHSRCLELHLFDFNDDIYGCELEVEFHEFIRADKVFPSVEQLHAQIQQDIAVTRKLLSAE